MLIYNYTHYTDNKYFHDSTKDWIRCHLNAFMASSLCKLSKMLISIIIRCHLLVQEILILLGANDASQCDLILLNLQTLKHFTVTL